MKDSFSEYLVETKISLIVRMLLESWLEESEVWLIIRLIIEGKIAEVLMKESVEATFFEKLTRTSLTAKAASPIRVFL